MAWRNGENNNEMAKAKISISGVAQWRQWQISNE
jgi:hypothetical protein